MTLADQNSHFRLWQFSDTHLHADVARQMYGINCDAALQQVLSTAMSIAGTAELCLLTGDLVHDESEAGYRRLRAYLEDLAVPVYCMPGNHDAVELMRKTLLSKNVSCVGHLVHRQWLIVLLDTTIAGSHAGHLSEAECQRLESLLRQYPTQHVLLAMHHPPLSTAMRWLDEGVTLDNPERVHALVANHSRIRAVIWGHAHQELLVVRGDVLWAGCPSTMAQFRPGVDEFTLDDKRPGFRWLDLWDDGEVTSGVIRVA